MRAAVFEGDGVVTVTERPDPTIVDSRDVILRVAANGICGSDLHALRVPPAIVYPPGIVIGHEYVGTIEEAGPASPYAVGTRVVVHPNVVCGHCWYCRNGRSNVCEQQDALGCTVDGGTSEFARVPSSNIFPIPDDLPLDRAILAEPLACILNGTRKAQMHAGESLVVLGAGPIGALYLAVLRQNGAGPAIVSEPSPARRALALELGADIAIDPTTEDVIERVREETDGLGADVVVDAHGSMLGDALQMIRKGGRVICFGATRSPREADFLPLIHRKEANIRGVFDAADNIPLAIRLLHQDRVGFDRLVTHRLPLDQFDAAVESARSGVAMKAAVVVDEALFAR